MNRIVAAGTSIVAAATLTIGGVAYANERNESRALREQIAAQKAAQLQADIAEANAVALADQKAMEESQASADEALAKYWLEEKARKSDTNGWLPDWVPSWVPSGLGGAVVGGGIVATALCLGYNVPVWIASGGWLFPGTATCVGVWL